MLFYRNSTRQNISPECTENASTQIWTQISNPPKTCTKSAFKRDNSLPHIYIRIQQITMIIIWSKWTTFNEQLATEWHWCIWLLFGRDYQSTCSAHSFIQVDVYLYSVVPNALTTLNIVNKHHLISFTCDKLLHRKEHNI